MKHGKRDEKRDEKGGASHRWNPNSEDLDCTRRTFRSEATNGRMVRPAAEAQRTSPPRAGSDRWGWGLGSPHPGVASKRTKERAVEPPDGPREKLRTSRIRAGVTW